MSENGTTLRRRKLSTEEIGKSSNRAVKKALREKNIKDLAEQFIDPDTKQLDVAVGEAIAVGEWDNHVDAENFATRHLPAAIDLLIKQYGWTEVTTKGGKRIATYSHEVHPIDGTGKYEVWIFRTKG